MKNILLAAVLFLSIFGVSCQAGYWDRNNTQEVAAAEARAATAEKALTTVLAQKENADKALVLAQVALDAAKAAGMDADKIAQAQKAVAFAESKKAEAFEFAAKLSEEVKSSKTAAEAAKASGTGQSAAERDSAIVGGIISTVGSLFGPGGAAAGLGLSGLLALLVRSKSKQVTEANVKVNAAKKVIQAVEAVKASAMGGDGVVNFNDPASVKVMNKAMGADGKKFVDEAQSA